MSLAAASQLPTVPGAILRMSLIGLVVDFTYCGLAVSLTICQSDRNGNAGKLMARHSQCNFFKFFSELLQYPDILATIPSSSKSPTILSAPPNMPPSFFAGLQMQPAPLHAAGTLAFPRPLKWEAVAQERVPSAASLWHCVVHVACTIVALISRVIVYGCGYEYARWRGIPFTRRFSCCSMMRRRDSRGRKCSVDWECHVGWCQQLCLPAMQLVILCSHVHLVRET
ncbi:hypothetical protein EDB19DRAFT_1903610 [Suillus lakei]|nr:hypothetical protein EDB19DRAFT_1903610 [Suillus lakei]